jgi:hypothetical protein
MTEYSISTRLREITSDMRVMARDQDKTNGPTLLSMRGGLEVFAERLNEIILELDQPSAGTSAYTMMAEAERVNLDATETLIYMVAATVLAKLIEDEGGGRANIEFTPQDMDNMHLRYEIDAKRDGMITMVKIVPRAGAFDKEKRVVNTHEDILGVIVDTTPAVDVDQPEPPESFYRHPGNLDLENPALDQVPEHVYDRPLWATRVDGKLFPASDRTQAERMVKGAKGDQIATIENRFCYHKECPDSRCNLVKTEVASEI